LSGSLNQEVDCAVLGDLLLIETDFILGAAEFTLPGLLGVAVHLFYLNEGAMDVKYGLAGSADLRIASGHGSVVLQAS